MLKQLFMGMQSAVSYVHAQALEHCTTNDRIRLPFNDLLKSVEPDIIDTVIKYGKVKGWLEKSLLLLSSPIK